MNFFKRLGQWVTGKLKKGGGSGNPFAIGTIRTRLLVAFVLIVLVAAGTISGVTVALGSQTARQREVSQLESVVTLKESEIKAWVGWLRVNLEIVVSDAATMSDINTLNRGPADSADYLAAYGRLQERFNWAVESMGLFDELFLMDKEGNVLLSTNTAHESEKHSIYDYFTEGMKGPYIQQPSYSLSLGKMTVVNSSPVRDNGDTIGVLAGRASLESLNTIMIERTGLGATGETYLVGSNHRLLTDLRGDGYAIPETYVRTPGADAAVDSHWSGSATYANYRGDSVIGVYRWLPELQVALLAEQNEEEALYATRMTMMIIGGAALVAVVFAIFAALFLTSGIVRPLAELANTAALIAGGDLDRVARVERDDEVGTLAGAFNSMTARLRDLLRGMERRTDQLRAINDTGRQISSILNIDELLGYVANSLQKTFNYHNVGIILIDPSSGALELKSSAGAYEGESGASRLSRENKGIVGTVATTGNAVMVNDVQNDPDYRQIEGSGHTRAELAVPIKRGDRLTGILDIEADHAQAFDELDLFTAQTLSDQLAIAIENARLYEQAKELATIQERNRLARDLHDAVSQTLFSASLIAEVLPRIWERNQAEGKKRLDEVRQLTRGALAEMRTLLLELRPAALVAADLGELLHQLAESITGRARIPVSVEVNGQYPQTPDVKVALYRIAQEALNNVAKHSGASQAKVCLDCGPDGIRLTVTDNGKGFDMATTKPTSLGLGIMRDRTKGIGATVDIESHPGEGTKVTVVWKNKSV